MFNKFLLVLSVVFCSGLSFAASDYNFTPTYEPSIQSYKVPLVRDGRTKIPFIELRVNGRKALFLLNIGSSNTFISEIFAKNIGLTLRESSLKGVGSLKGEALKLTFVDSLLVGKTDFKDFDLISMNFEHLDKTLPFNVDGILGGNVLRLYPYKLDFENNYSEFNVTFQPDDAFNFRAKNNKIIIPVTVNGISSEFQLNTGTVTTKISNSLLNSINPKDSSLKNITENYVDVGGKRKVKRKVVSISSLNFLNKRLTGFKIKSGRKNLLAMDVLNNEVLMLDYKNKKIKLGDSL